MSRYRNNTLVALIFHLKALPFENYITHNSVKKSPLIRDYKNKNKCLALSHTV